MWYRTKIKILERLIFLKYRVKPGVVAYVCNPSTQNAKAGHTGICKILHQKNSKTKTKFSLYLVRAFESSSSVCQSLERSYGMTLYWPWPASCKGRQHLVSLLYRLVLSCLTRSMSRGKVAIGRQHQMILAAFSRTFPIWSQ